MVRVDLTVPPALKAAVVARARLEGVPVAQCAREALERGLSREPREGESPLDEAVRLLAERAREGNVQATVAYARMVAKGAAPPESAGDPVDDLAARRRRA